MEFTYDSYKSMIDNLQKGDYSFAGYHNWQDCLQRGRCVILRHDLDFDVKKAVMFSEIEKEMGVTGTYFVMLTSSLYNVCSKETGEMLRQIQDNGHTIGLHYDETRYPEAFGNRDALVNNIKKEAKILESVLDTGIDCVSMHRPSREILDIDLMIPGMINSYSKVFFHEFEYVSDARKRWRKQVDSIISEKRSNKLHILTHPIWYDEKECSIHDSLMNLIGSGNRKVYDELRKNITDCDSVIDPSEIEGV